MDADELLAKALQHLEREDYEQARACLRRAASMAPLRNDVRELLKYSIEESPSSSKRPAPKSGATAARRAESPPPPAAGFREPIRSGGSATRFLVWTGLILVVCGAAALGVLHATGRIDLAALIERAPHLEMQAPGSRVDGETSVEQDAPLDAVGLRRRQLRERAERNAAAEEWEAAVAALDELLETTPPDRESVEDLRARYAFEAGRALLRERPPKTVRAAELLEEAVDRRPGEALWRLHLGRAFFLGRDDFPNRSEAESLSAARSQLERAVELEPGLLDAYEPLALARIRQGDAAAGAQAYRELIRRAPDTDYAARARRNLTSMGMRP